MRTQLLNTLKVSLLAIVLSFGMNYALAWTAPTTTPPAGNVSAPLNTSATAQTKAGALVVGSLNAGSGNILTGGEVHSWNVTANTVSTVSDIIVNGMNIGRGGGNILYNTAVGISALGRNTTGSYNTALGEGSIGSYNGTFNTGSHNTATGNNTLQTNTSGSNNTANGSQALLSNTTGMNNVAIGYMALSANTTASQNIAIGAYALRSSIGALNTAIGDQSQTSNTTGYANTAMGISSLNNNTTGIDNTAFGAGALSAIVSGNYNTAIGFGAGPGTTNPSAPTLTNTTAIGYNALPTASNMVRIGGSTVTSINGAVGFSVVSDSRLKENVVDYNHGLDFIMKLRPVTYNLIADATKVTHSGFIAQEVEGTGVPFYGINKPANKNDFYSLNYSEFVVPLVNSVKELKTENDTLNTKVQNLQAENDALLARIEKIEARLK